MSATPVEQVANAVLYEGYILYPYRPSSVKNRQRWTFGGIYPRAYSEAQVGSDAWSVQVQCLVLAEDSPSVDVGVRFLQLVERQVGALEPPVAVLPVGAEPGFRPVPALHVGDTVLRAWQEAVEREVCITDLSLGTLIDRPAHTAFAFAAHRDLEPVCDVPSSALHATLTHQGDDTPAQRDVTTQYLPASAGQSDGETALTLRDGLRAEQMAASPNAIVGVIVREQQAIVGAVDVSAEPLGGAESPTRPGAERLFKLTARLSNLTSFDVVDPSEREAALLHSLVSAHAILRVRGGTFVSLQDPPPGLEAPVAACANAGLWPVLAGDPERHDTLLAAPIILYDYPQIAPESPGDLFDGTEIDEILTLRIMTMTDAEKAEMRQSDERARALLERTESLSAADLMGLHGTMRNRSWRTGSAAAEMVTGGTLHTHAREQGSHPDRAPSATGEEGGS